jgi:glycosyltransferase involved in cell wall biosynthesis
MALISVIMPVWNSARYVGEAIDSILAQTLADYELLIIDDGSTDGTPEILRRYEKTDTRIRVLWQDHGGSVPGLNRGLAEARGEFIARMDADDIAMPDRFAIQVAYLQSHTACVVTGAAMLYVDPDGAPIDTQEAETDPETLLRNLLLLNPEPKSGLAHPTAMMRRKDVEAVGGYRSEFESTEDVDLWLRLAERGALGNVPEVLLHYRLHEESVSHRRRIIQARHHFQLAREGCQRRGLAWPEREFEADEAPTAPRELYREWCRRACVAGHRRTALKYAMKLLTGPPRRASWWALGDALLGIATTDALKRFYGRHLRGLVPGHSAKANPQP